MDGTPSSSPLTGAVLITGASYGLGYELTRCFAADGHALILVARSGDRLRTVAQELSQAHGVQVDTVALDLTQLDAARMLFEEIQRRGHTVEILVNNAGFGTYGRFSDIDFDAETREMQLNMLTPTQLTKLFLPGMLAQRRGQVVNMASMAGYLPGPYMAIYFATKAYLLSFSEAIAEELRGSGVAVTAVCPNVVATRFQETAHNQAAYIGGRFRPLMADAPTTARQAYALIRARRTVAIPGWSNRLAVAALGLIPRALMRRAMVPFQKGPDIADYPKAR